MVMDSRKMWRRGKKLGGGASGNVFLTIGNNQKTDAPLVQAVKSSVSPSLSNYYTLCRERLLLEKFGDCPYIINSFGDDFTIENGKGYYNLFLEYASGGSLYNRIKAGSGGLAEWEVRTHAESILKGLDCIHKEGYVHCDIKPDNILLMEKESVQVLNGKRKRYCELTAKIADFGLAERADAGKDNLDVKGTYMYVAPESVEQNCYGPKVDIWAFGCTVLQMLTGKTPWDKKLEPFRILFRVGFQKEIPEIPHWLSEEARDFLDKCLVSDPEFRWSADMLLNHRFVCSKARRTSTEVGESREIEEKPEAHEEDLSFCGSDECISLLVKPDFLLSDNEKRKGIKMIMEEGINYGVLYFRERGYAEKETMIPSVDSRIQIFD